MMEPSPEQDESSSPASSQGKGTDREGEAEILHGGGVPSSPKSQRESSEEPPKPTASENASVDQRGSAETGISSQQRSSEPNLFDSPVSSVISDKPTEKVPESVQNISVCASPKFEAPVKASKIPPGASKFAREIMLAEQISIDTGTESDSSDPPSASIDEVTTHESLCSSSSSDKVGERHAVRTRVRSWEKKASTPPESEPKDTPRATHSIAKKGRPSIAASNTKSSATKSASSDKEYDVSALVKGLKPIKVSAPGPHQSRLMMTNPYLTAPSAEKKVDMQESTAKPKPKSKKAKKRKSRKSRRKPRRRPRVPGKARHRAQAGGRRGHF